MRRSVLTAIALLGLVACGGDAGHPWLAIPDTYPHQLIESEGAGGGQLVIAVPPETSPQTALELGRVILSQAPEGVVVNARIYNDEATARNWRTVAAEWTLEHLWVLARRTGDGDEEVRWVGPSDVEGAPAAESMADTTAATEAEAGTADL